jgi:L-fuconolactonase
MRIDSHQHFLDLSQFDYNWIPAPSSLQRDFLPPDFGPILERNHFDGSVAVQATTDPREAEWLLRLASEYPFILGVVAWVDLTDPACGHTLDTLQKHPRLAGIRHPVHDEVDDRWLLRPDVINGLRELERRRLPFDLLLRPYHLPLIPEFVAQVPDLPLVIDHMAKPLIARGHMDPWASDIARAAEIPHMHVKISGLITEADHEHWNAKQLQPYVSHVWNVFGPERCMFGSDWPVCLLAGIWKEVLAATTQALGPIPQEVRAGFMGDNAARFYRLNQA